MSDPWSKYSSAQGPSWQGHGISYAAPTHHQRVWGSYLPMMQGSGVGHTKQHQTHHYMKHVVGGIPHMGTVAFNQHMNRQAKVQQTHQLLQPHPQKIKSPPRNR